MQRRPSVGGMQLLWPGRVHYTDKERPQHREEGYCITVAGRQATMHHSEEGGPKVGGKEMQAM